ncbi:hypothetical protein BC834DRAFT_656441 [Gloeopeniophorella convolvens]|nr:hypothetical protein BC834DRAFT_656441 [Gloeopeniophorella convolvens]
MTVHQYVSPTTAFLFKPYLYTHTPTYHNHCRRPRRTGAPTVRPAPCFPAVIVESGPWFTPDVRTGSGAIADELSIHKLPWSRKRDNWLRGMVGRNEQKCSVTAGNQPKLGHSGRLAYSRVSTRLTRQRALGSVLLRFGLFLAGVGRRPPLCDLMWLLC